MNGAEEEIGGGKACRSRAEQGSEEIGRGARLLCKLAALDRETGVGAEEASARVR